MLAKSLSLQIIAPVFIIMLVAFFIPRFFIGSLDILLGYFLAYAAVSPFFKARVKERRYRFSFLKFLVSFILMWQRFDLGKRQFFTRAIAPLIFSFIQVALMGLSFWYLPLCALAGWGIFEIYFAKYLKSFIPEDQRDDREIDPMSQSVESVSVLPLETQSHQTDSEKLP